MIKTIIFDLDGTLADTMPDLSSAMNSMLRHFGYPERSREQLLGAINHGSRYFVTQSLPESARDDEAVIDAAHRLYNDTYSKAYIVDTCPYNGIICILDRLAADGYKLAVLSNKRNDHVRAIIAKLFGSRFVSVWGQSELPEKPDPAGAFRIADETNAKPSECVFIGDSDIDMKTANNAGMYAVGVKWGYRDEATLKSAGAKSIAGTPSELLSIISNLI